MNKSELVSSITAKSGLSKADAKKAVDACVESIVEALKGGDKVSLVGFGTFAVIERPARQGMNPLTKKPISIAAKKVAKFKAGSETMLSTNLFVPNNEGDAIAPPFLLPIPYFTTSFFPFTMFKT